MHIYISLSKFVQDAWALRVSGLEIRSKCSKFDQNARNSIKMLEIQSKCSKLNKIARNSINYAQICTALDQLCSKFNQMCLQFDQICSNFDQICSAFYQNAWNPIKLLELRSNILEMRTYIDDSFFLNRIAWSTLPVLIHFFVQIPFLI